jgi:hypothetical protein
MTEYFAIDGAGTRVAQTVALVCQLASREILKETWRKILDEGKEYHEALSEMAEDVVDVGFMLADYENKLEDVPDVKWLRIAQVKKDEEK